MFSSLTIEEEHQRVFKQSISGQACLLDTNKARSAKTNAKPVSTAAAVKKQTKVRKESISGHLKAYDCSVSDGLSDLHPAQNHQEQEYGSPAALNPSSLKKTQGSKMKKLAKASLSKSLGFLKNSRLSKAKGKACGESSSQDSANGNMTLPLKGEVLKKKSPVTRKPRTSMSMAASSTAGAEAGTREPNLKQSRSNMTSQDPHAKVEKARGHTKDADVQCQGKDSNIEPIRKNPSESRDPDEEKSVDGSSSNTIASPRNKKGSPMLAYSRLSYSGRRARAQRKSLKRKSEEVSNMVKKKLCFDLETKEDCNKDPIESDINPAETPLDHQDDVGDNLVSVDMDITKAEESIKGDDVNVAAASVNNPIPLSEPCDVQEPKDVDESSKYLHGKDNGLDNNTTVINNKDISKSTKDEKSKGLNRATKKRKTDSVKFLFSESVMEDVESESEVRVPDVNDISMTAAKGTLPTFDEIYKKPKVKALSTRKSSVLRRSPRKIEGDKEASHVELSGTSSKKFFKTKSQDLAADKTADLVTAAKKKPAPASKGKISKGKATDPFSIWSPSPSPKVKRGPPRASYGQGRRRRTTGSKRRSEKLFSDDSDKESVGLQRVMSKSMPDYVFVNKDAAGDSADASFNINNHQTRKKAKSSSKGPPSKAAKATMKFLDHVVGVLDSFTEQVDGVSQLVLKDICFFITEKTDMLILNQ